MVDQERNGREDSNGSPAGVELSTTRGKEGARGRETKSISLKGKRFCVFGLQGSGKTVLSKEIAMRHKSVVFDIHGEYPISHFYRWVPNAKQEGPELTKEFETAADEFIFSKNYDFELLLIDEANQYFPNGKPLPPAMARINDYNRHMGLAFGCIARRPTQLNTDLVELSHYLFIFSLHGKNTKRYLNDIHEGMGDAAATLKPHHFITYDVTFGNWEVCEPIQISGKRK